MSTVRLDVQPIDLNFSLKDRIYEALKETIAQMNIYQGEGEPRLDERQLSEDLGVSRTPVREAIQRLAQEVGILAELHHPCIVRVLDTGVAAGEIPYVVIEWVEGLPCYRLEHHSLDAAIAAISDLELLVRPASQPAG